MVTSTHTTICRHTHPVSQMQLWARTQVFSLQACHASMGLITVSHICICQELQSPLLCWEPLVPCRRGHTILLLCHSMSVIASGIWPGLERTADDLHPILRIHAIHTGGPHSEANNGLRPFNTKCCCSRLC